MPKKGKKNLKLRRSKISDVSKPTNLDQEKEVQTKLQDNDILRAFSKAGISQNMLPKDHTGEEMLKLISEVKDDFLRSVLYDWFSKFTQSLKSELGSNAPLGPVKQRCNFLRARAFEKAQAEEAAKAAKQEEAELAAAKAAEELLLEVEQEEAIKSAKSKKKATKKRERKELQKQQKKEVEIAAKELLLLKEEESTKATTESTTKTELALAEDEQEFKGFLFVFKECESLFSKNNQVTKKDDEVPDEKIILPNIYRLIESQLEINQQCKTLSALKKRCAELLVQKQEGRNIKGEAIESHSHQRSKKLVAETPNVLPFSEICKVIDKVYPDISEFAPDDFFLSTSSLSSRATSSMERFP